MLYGSETSPVKEEDMIKLERNDTSIVRWMCNVRPEDRIFIEELRTRLKLKSMRVLEDGRLKWFGYLERMKRVVGLVKAEPAGLAIVSTEDDQRKHGMR